MTGIKNALTRKFGPLPAWAWLTIVAAGAYFYRSRGAGGGGGGTASATDMGGATPDAPTPQDPVTLQPGESVYNPNTGQLIGTAPEQQPGEAPEVVPPIPADPVETNDFNDDPATAAAAPTPTAGKKPNALARAKAAVLRGRVGPTNRQRLRHAGYSDAQIDFHAKRKTALATPQSKKKPKPKAQHKPAKPVAHPTPVKGKPRGSGVFRKPVTRKPPVTHKPKPAAKPRPKPAPVARAPIRKVAPAAAKPVTRQRPAPAHTTKRKTKTK